MNNAKLFLPFLGLLLLFSCKKPEEQQGCQANCLTISGRVGSGEYSATPVEGSLISVKWEYLNWNESNFETVLIGDAYSDKDGNYSISGEFDTEYNIADGYLRLSASKPGHLEIMDQSIKLFHADTSLHQNVHLPKIAYLKLQVEGFNLSDEDNHLDILPRYRNYMESFLPLANLIEGQRIFSSPPQPAFALQPVGPSANS